MKASEEHDRAAARVTRDHLTAGLVLTHGLLTGQVSPESAWPAISDFHAAVVVPLLDDDSVLTEVEKRDLLCWARANGGVAAFTEVAYAPTRGSAAAPENDMLFDLLELAERIGNASGAPGAPSGDEGPDILVQGPDARCVVLTSRSAIGETWQTALADTEDAAVEAALRDVLFPFPTTWRAAWSSEADRPSCIWWPPGVQLSAPATTLPVALWHLGRIAGLGSRGLLSAGDFAGESCLPVEGAALTARTQAAAAAERELLLPTRTGWCRVECDGTTRAVDGPLTLDGAATVMWGEDWLRWKRERHADELAALEWRVIDWRRTPEYQPIADLDVSQSQRLMRHFLDSSGGSVAVLGGTPRSGKSAIVRRLAVGLTGRKRNPWLVRVLAGPTRELPDRHVATAAGRHALASLEERSERQLLVFEDLHPIGDDRADEVLRHVSNELDVPVLGVLQYSDNSPIEWRCNGLFVVTSVVGPQARERFVADVAEADPRLDAATGRAALAGHHGEDLRRITQMMSADRDPGARLAARFAELAESERTPLVLTAAMSLIGGELDAERLEPVEESDRYLFGVEPGNRRSSVRLMGLNDCFALIDLHREDRTQEEANSDRSHTDMRNETIADLVEPELAHTLEEGSPRVADLLTGARLFDRALSAELLRRAVDERLLTPWVSSAPVRSVVRVLGLSELLAEQTTQAIVEELVKKLPLESPDWHPAPLLALVRSLQDLEFLLPDQVREEFVRWLVQVVDHLLHQRVGLPEERFALLVALERFNSDEVKDLLAERVLDVLDGLRVDQVSGYRLVRQVEEMQRRLERRSSTDLSIFPVDQEHPVQLLLTHLPDEKDGVTVLIESMGLRQQFEKLEWEIRFQPYELPLTAAMRFATAAELADTLNNLRTSMPLFCTWLLSNWKDFPARTRTLLHRSAPTEAATLLNAIAKSNAVSASGILYKSYDAVDYDLVKTFARRINNVDDAIGAGLLLSVTHAVGELFHSGSDIFSTELAEEIGEQKIRDMIHHDPRTSTRYYLIKGVWDAEASYRERALDVVLDLVVQSVKHGRKHWGAEIALDLGADPELGVRVLGELRERIAPGVLIRGMLNAPTAHTRVMFHRLGRVLHADVPASYLEQWELNAFVEGLTTSAPTAALEVCAETAKTLTDADVPDAGPMILAGTGGADVWAQRLAFGRKAEAFAQAISNLTALDPNSACQVIEQLRARQSYVRIGAQTVDTLLAWLRKAMLYDSTAASAVLRAVDDAKPGLGADLLAEVAQDKHAIYVFRGDIQQVQDPVTQSTAAANFLRAGMTRGSANSGWIDSVYLARIQTIDRFTSPRAVVALLRMMSAWDAQWGATAAAQINLSRIGRRIRSGRTVDLPATVALTRTLCALDNRAAAQHVATDLAANDLNAIGERAGLDTISQLVDILQELSPDVVPRILRAMHGVVDSTVRRFVVLNERAIWQQVGRARWSMRHLGALTGPISEPGIRPNVAHAPAAAWAAMELDKPDWGDDALGRMRSRLQQRAFANSTDQACVLLATTRGWAPELRSASMTWDVGRAPLWLLRLLYQEALVDPYLPPLLAASEPVIRNRVFHAAARSDWDASRLRLVLSAPVTAGSRSPMDAMRSRRPETPSGTGGVPTNET